MLKSNNIKFILAIIVIFLVGILLGLFGGKVLFFLNSYRSDYILDLITLLVGFIALIIYFTQKRDSKKDAANIIYLEIAYAAKILKDAKEGLEKGNLSENVLTIPSMQNESWTKYKYLFARNFDDKDWNEIEDFYKKCSLYDQAVVHNKSIFQKNEEQIRINLTKFLAEYSKENPVQMSKIQMDDKEKKKWRELEEVTNNFQQMILTRSASYMYQPSKPVNDAKLYLNNMNLDILQSTAIQELKKLAGKN